VGVLYDLLLRLRYLAFQDLIGLDHRLAEILQQHLLLIVQLALLEELFSNRLVELASAHAVKRSIDLIPRVV
jgi:hypothetical protein